MNQMLIIGCVWPEPNSTAAGSRMMQLIHAFLGAGWQITFACAAVKTPHMADIEALGVNTAEIELNNTSFDVFVSALMPDVVIFDRFICEEQFGWRVEQYCPDALRVIDSEDLHCLREGRLQAYKKNRVLTDEDLFCDVAKREIAAILRADLTLVISEFEIRLLQDKFNIDSTLLHYTPFMVDDALSRIDQNNSPDFVNRENFISIGNFRHAPNWDSVLYLKQTIWPLIRKQLPQAELHVYGSYPTPKAMQLHDPREGFHVLGWVEDSTRAMSQARVCLAPLRFGAGLKGKLLQAMQCGTPGITTSIGAEGMFGNNEKNFSVENDPESFAQAAVAMYTDEQQWHRCQATGWQVLTERFEPKGHETDLLNRLSEARKHLKANRLRNFTGAMLRHHSLKSTHYMARWLELKKLQDQIDKLNA
jgi:glycosyltransferase involved in cell wall biosynthesis